MLNDMINIAKLLKDAPKGMKLYSPLLGEVEFVEVMDTGYMPIRVMKRGYGLRFDKYGRYMGNEYPDAECVLFPSKEVRTWEGWKPPVEPKFKVVDWIVSNTTTSAVLKVNKVLDIIYELIDLDGDDFHCEQKNVDKNYHLWTIADAKDGDVLVTTKERICPFIYRKNVYNNNLAYYYVGIDGNGDFCEGCIKRTLSHFGPTSDVVPATKEQRDLLFTKMKEAGYTWDKEKKELKKIQHYDIANFHEGMPVLVRDKDNRKWCYLLYSHYDNTYEDGLCFNAGSVDWRQCIPFNEKTKHLLGTTDMCPEEYINW